MNTQKWMKRTPGFESALKNLTFNIFVQHLQVYFLEYILPNPTDVPEIFKSASTDPS